MKTRIIALLVTGILFASSAGIASAQQLLTCGDLIPGSIDVAGEADFFTFTGQAGDEILLTLVQTGGFGGPSRAQATLFDPMNVASCLPLTRTARNASHLRKAALMWCGCGPTIWSAPVPTTWAWNA